MSSAPLPTYSKVCFFLNFGLFLYSALIVSLCHELMHLRHIFWYVLLWDIFICLKDATICRLYFFVIHRFVHSFTFLVTRMRKQSVLLATFRGGFLNRSYLWCKRSRLLPLEIQTQTLRPYLNIWTSHVSFLHDSKVFISCLCSGFELLVYFYMFYWVWTKSLNLKEIFVYSTITTFYCLLSIITDCFTSQMCLDQSD